MMSDRMNPGKQGMPGDGEVRGWEEQSVSGDGNELIFV